MTPSVTEVPQELQKLPQAWLDAIHQACAGDWRRVEVLGPREWIVHNQPQMRRTVLPDVRPKTKSSTRKVAARPLPMDRDPVRLPLDMDPMVAARAMLEEFRQGIHLTIYVEIAEYLLNLPNMLVDLGMAAVRHPQRVEIDPTTEEKKSPRLRFVRGDVMAVIGFNNLTQPYVIAIKQL